MEGVDNEVKVLAIDLRRCCIVGLFAQLAALAAMLCLGAPAWAIELAARIKHDPVEFAPSGIRIELAADIQDAAGVDLARVYFKAQREANYLFVPMRVAGAGGYSAVLPAPSAGVGAVEYQILVRNLGGVVYKTQTYSVDIEDGEAAVVENNEPIEVFTELAEAPDVVHGFTDNIALDAVESAAKYGVVAGLTSQAGAGTTAGAVGGTSGGTVTAAGGAGAAGGTAAGAGAAAAGAGVGTTVATVAAATAAVAGGVVAATDGNENEPPEFSDSSPLALPVPENTTGPIGDPVTAMDSDDDTLNYSLTGADAGAFAIDGSSGQLRVAASTTLDYETRVDYSFEVVASDGDLKASRTVNITVTNLAPAFAESGDLSLSVLENRPGDISGGVASASDPGGGEVTYSLDGADAASFSIDGSGQLSVPVSTKLDFETKSEYRFEVVAADPAGEEARRKVVVTVLDGNEAPAFANGDLLVLPVAEGATGAFGEPVAAVDPDGDTLTYKLVGADAASFSIDGSGQLSVPVSTKLDFETKSEYRFEVVAADSGGLEAKRTVVVTVTEVFIGNFDIFLEEEGFEVDLCITDRTGGSYQTVTVKLNRAVLFEEVEMSLGWSCKRVPVNPGGNSIEIYAHSLGSGLLQVTGLNTATESWSLGKDETGGAVLNAVVDEDQKASEADWKALVALYRATEGSEWYVNENWDPNLDRVPMARELASWYGVNVFNGRVTGLVLPGNNLDGPLPQELGDLTKLRELALPDNNLAGSLPAELGSLVNLRTLWLSSNRLTGSILPELGSLVNLQSLSLYTNQLTGPLPPELGGLVRLNLLSLSDNRLSGPMPSSLTNLSMLDWFDWHTQDVDEPDVPLCAPTDEAFQAWLKGVANLGPNCSAESAASSVAGPKVTNLAIVSSPGPDGVYAAGEAIEAAVRFDRSVTVSGTPQLRLGVGNALAAAVHALPDGRETETLTFRYTVAQGDHDADGVSVGGGALLLNGGAIVGANGAAAALSLGAHAIRNAAEHIVDARVREAEKAILEDALAAQGRAHLASVTDVIGERFRAGPAAPFSLRDRLRLGSGLPAGAPGADALAMNDLGAFSMGPGARSLQMPGLSGGASPLVPGRGAWPSGTAGAAPSGMADTASLGGRGGFSLGSLFGNDFAIPLSADQEESSGAGWTLWGAHDLQSFRAATDNGSYDGDLRSLYLGIDGRIGDSWLAGVALSRSRGEIDYGFEVDALQGEGALRTRLSSVYPYLHGELASGMEVWGIAGFGSGKATLRREESDAVERSDLGLGLGSMGLRQGLREFGSLKLSLLADAGLARLWTGGGSDTLDALSATVGRVRVGVEGEHDLTLAGGALQPFWRVSGRYDGGDGVTGGGLELATGVRYRSERLEAQVQGRWLTMHSASSQEEFGASASLRINARANGLGFAASLSPRWGAAEGSGAIWREDLLRDSHRLPAQRANPWSMDGRLEYGFALPRMAGVLKPFGETRLAGESSARQRFGLRFDRSVNDWSLLGVELGLGCVGRPTGGTDHAIDLTVDAWF